MIQLKTSEIALKRVFCYLVQSWDLLWKFKNMNTPVNRAWLIGLYTNDLEERIEGLGFKLTRFSSFLNMADWVDDKPSLIVFSEDRFSDLRLMALAKDFYPEAVLISLPAGAEEENEYEYPQNMDADSSISRLTSNIRERVHRWDN